MADVLWVLICLATRPMSDLTDALKKNFSKKNVRDALKHQQNEKLKKKSNNRNWHYFFHSKYVAKEILDIQAVFTDFFGKGY